MPTFDASGATCRVFTEKDGLLSRLAHDLELDVTDFSITAEDVAVEGTFNPRSLKVLHALKDGQPTASLSDKDKREIEGNVSREVLTASGPIHFRSSSVQRTERGGRVSGTLTVNGRARTVEFDVRRDGERFVVEFPLHQPDFGIKPFSAMMGSLKIKPTVRVRVSLPCWS